MHRAQDTWLRRIGLCTAVCLLVLPQLALALGLGPLHLNSSLGEPFAARIPLISIPPAVRDSLRVHVGGARLYRLYNLHRSPAISKIEADVAPSQINDRTVMVQLTSVRPIKAPLLELLVVAQTNRGRMVRRYTVFLNPAGWDGSGVTVDNTTDTVLGDFSQTQASAAHTQQPVSSNESRLPGGGRQAPERTTPAPSSAGGHVVSVESGQTLWGIAKALGYDELSTYQVAVAIYHMNPEAFGEGISELMAGSTLAMPTRRRAQMVDLSQARALVNQSQNARLERLVAQVNAEQYVPSGYFTGPASQSDSAGKGTDGRLQLRPADNVVLNQNNQPAGSDETPAGSAGANTTVAIGSEFGVLTIPAKFMGNAESGGLSASAGGGKYVPGTGSAGGSTFGQLAMPSFNSFAETAKTGKQRGITSQARHPNATANSAKPVQTAQAINGQVSTAGQQPGTDKKTAPPQTVASTRHAAGEDNTKHALENKTAQTGQTGNTALAQRSSGQASPHRQQAASSSFRRVLDSIAGFFTLQHILWIIAALSLLIAALLWLQPKRRRQSSTPLSAADEQADESNSQG